MSFSRRAYDMELGRRDHTRWLGVHRVSSRLTLPTTNLLAAWDARAGVTDVSGACSAWADQSGNGWHASQGTAGNRPDISSKDGFSSLLFGGLDLMLTADTMGSAGVKSVYAVVNPTAFGSVRTIVNLSQTTQATAESSSNVYGARNIAFCTNVTAMAAGLQRISWEMSASGVQFWKNGVAGTPNAAWTLDPITGVIYIGARAAGTGRFQGHILFLAIYNDARNPDVEDYITQEWGV